MSRIDDLVEALTTKALEDNYQGVSVHGWEQNGLEQFTHDRGLPDLPQYVDARITFAAAIPFSKGFLDDEAIPIDILVQAVYPGLMKSLTDAVKQWLEGIPDGI